MYPNCRVKQGEKPGITLVTAGAVIDAAATAISPACVAVEADERGGRRIVAVGSAEQVKRTLAGRRWTQVHRPGALVVPGLVNTHVHLQLTSIGPLAYRGDFAGWVGDISTCWKRLVEQAGGDREAVVRESVEQGVNQSLAGGVTCVGDIASWDVSAARYLMQSSLSGVAFVELLGIGGATLQKGLARLAELEAGDRPVGKMRMGLEPHAPYSTGPGMYEAATRAAAGHGWRLTTHLAELTEEQELVRTRSGAMRELLERLGKWEPGYDALYGGCRSAVAWMEPHLRQAPWLLAHCNYVDDADIALLAECGASVAYCPRASEYFGHRGHRYRDMLAVGVNVCLGTDSLVCHGTLSIIDEMRRLHQRDGTDAMTLLKMGTINGMRGLGLDEKDATLRAGSAAKLVVIENAAGETLSAIDAWHNVLKDNRTLTMDVI